MNWYFNAWRHYADFSGRARRTEYFLFVFGNQLVSFALIFGETYLHVGKLPSSLFALASLVPTIAVAIRRMHDIDRSGWWALVPLVNIVFHFLPGTQGGNRFGRDPKGTGQAPMRRAA